MARLVDPVEARKGNFLYSFPVKGTRKETLDKYMGQQEALLIKFGLVHKEIVYTRIIAWGALNNRNDTWQVFIVNKTRS